MVFAALWNVLPAYDNPKGILFNWYKPYCTLNVVLCLYPGHRGICQYCKARSKDAKYLDLPSWLIKSSIYGNGFLSCFLILFNDLKSMENLNTPSSFLTR